MSFVAILVGLVVIGFLASGSAGAAPSPHPAPPGPQPPGPQPPGPPGPLPPGPILVNPGGLKIVQTSDNLWIAQVATKDPGAAGALNVRKLPGTNNPVVGTVPHGANVTVDLNKTGLDAKGTTWDFVVDHGGYADADFLVVLDRAPSNPNKA